MATTEETGPHGRPRRRNGRVRTGEGLLSLAKSLRVISLLAVEGELPLQAISERVGFGKSTTHRVLSTLREHGYVTQDAEQGRYRLHLKFWELGAQVLLGERVYGFALPQLQRLTRELDRPTNLSFYEDGEMLFVCRVAQQASAIVCSPMAMRAPAHCTAAGKVALAHQSSDEVERMSAHLEPITARTITDRELLEAELFEARRAGYALNRGEHQEGGCGLAAPIFDSLGGVAAVVGISCPQSSFSEGFLSNAIPRLLECTATLSVMLGYRIPPAAGDWIA